jgi:hypothetical protein
VTGDGAAGIERSFAQPLKTLKTLTNTKADNQDGVIAVGATSESLDD